MFWQIFSAQQKLQINSIFVSADTLRWICQITLRKMRVTNGTGARLLGLGQTQTDQAR